MGTTTAKPKVYTNEAWRHETFNGLVEPQPLKTMTATRVKGSGPVRRGDIYRVEFNGEFVGHVRCEGSSAWSIHHADGRVGNVGSNPWLGTLDRVVWTLAPQS